MGRHGLDMPQNTTALREQLLWTRARCTPSSTCSLEKRCQIAAASVERQRSPKVVPVWTVVSGIVTDREDALHDPESIGCRQANAYDRPALPPPGTCFQGITPWRDVP